MLLLLLALTLPHYTSAKFYIGRFKTVPTTPTTPTRSTSRARSMPYIIYPGEAGSENLAFNREPDNKQWWVQKRPRPAHHTFGYDTKRLGNIEPASAFGLTNNYGNDKYNGYTLVNKDEVKYVVPPFTPGGRVHVAFQFWVPISVGGFFVSSRDLEAALKSASPTAYLTSLFLHHVATNTSAAQLLGNLDASTVQAGVDKFLNWVMLHLNYPSLSPIDNSVQTDTDKLTDTSKLSEKDIPRKMTNTEMTHKTRRKRSSYKEGKSKPRRSKRSKQRKSHQSQHSGDRNPRQHRSTRVKRSSQDGWVTIGGNGNNKDKDEEDNTRAQNTSPLLAHGATLDQPEQVQNDRVLWGDEDDMLLHNTLHRPRPGNHRPDLDFTSPIDVPTTRPSNMRPPTRFTRPSPSRPSSSSWPSHFNNQHTPSSSSFPSSTSFPEKPPFHLTSFDDLALGVAIGGGGGSRGLDVGGRLSRLDYFFSNLHLSHEDCRRRVLCEVSRDQDTFAPLSDLISSETRLPVKIHEVSDKLLRSAEGARLLSYVEAVKVGQDRSQACEVFQYRCRVRAREVINTDILPIWREVVRWLTVKVLSQDSPINLT
ncbi:hypothetical protein Pcinc_020483 [Petrolisthes cinctipes]|uniref:Uncharacterized protein n=1 Tax=Petrolisthes cinctipes TaxID=88211 RepID=A0AAE1FJ15_PETCI|nr:hypothetical protein Pcinc_020483 [Petrolisthes cinctipes]